MKRRGMSTRVGAVILAASLVIGDAVPTLAAQSASIDETAVISAEVVETTEISETEEVSETTDAAKTTEASEAAEATEENADTKAAENVSITTPGKVNNLRFETEAANGEIDQSKLSWNAEQAAKYYQIRVVDGNGVEYAENIGYYNDAAGELKTGLSYYTNYTTNMDLGDLLEGELFGYKLENDSYVLAKDEKEKKLEIKENTSYTIQVRACNYKDGAYVFGEWSDAITYNFPTYQYKAEPVTGIVWSAENGTSAIVYQKGNNESVEMEIKDASGREYYRGAEVKDGKLVGTYYSTTDSSIYPKSGQTYLYEVKEGSNYPTLVTDTDGDYITAFVTGQAYTVRLRGVAGAGDSKAVSEWSEPLTITVSESNVPQVTGQLKYDSDTDYVSWNSVTDARGYEVELKDAAGNWYNAYSYKRDSTKQDYVYELVNIDTYYTRLDISGEYVYELDADGNPVTKKDTAGKTIVSGTPGTTYTVRVRAYNKKKDSGEKQYSEWSEALSFTVPAITTPGKVTGVKFADNEVSWNEESEQYASNYQVEIKDASGRLYIDNPSYEDEETGKIVYDYNNYPSTTFTVLDGISSYRTYVDQDGTPKAVIHPETGKDVTAMEEGETYTIRVRASRTLDGQTEPTYGEWSDAYTYTVPVNQISEGINAKPAQVTGLWIQTESEDDQQISTPTMRWNEIDNVDRYEVEIKDSKGNLYSYEPDIYNNEYHTNYLYTYTNENNVYSFSGKNAYTETGDVIRDEAGNPLSTFNKNETYTIRVRAINRYREYDQTAKEWKTWVQNNGDWSEAVSFKPAGDVAALTNFKLVREDEDKYYFSYDFNVDNFEGAVYYQIATDANFTDASLVQDWREAYSSSDADDSKLEISKENSNLKPSTTYYVRVVASRYGEPKQSMEKSRYAEIMATAAITGFTTNAQKTPKNITGLKVYSEDEYSYTLRFDAVLDEKNGDEYEIQFANDSNSANWSVIRRNSRYIDKDELPEGTSYIRAVAYVEVYNEATQDYEKVYGQPSNVITINKDTVTTSSIGKVALAENNDNSYVFSYSGALRLDEKVELWYSDSKNFETNKKDTHTVYGWVNANENKKVTISKSALTPGKTYYVKMRTYNNGANKAEQEYSAFSNVVKVKAAVPEIAVSCAYVTKDSITLNMGTSAQVTGYEIQRKSVSGKKTVWTTLAQTSSPSYTDKKLKADTTYSYRVRPYFFDTDTNKIVNGTWEYCEAMTGWGGALKLQAKAASKTSVKLSWSKISGTKGYEVYRCVSTSGTTEISNGEGNGYSKYKLVADLSSSKKSYTDKGLTSGMAYAYRVKAYKMVDNKKVYIEETANVALDFKLTEISRVKKSNGKVTVTWNPVYTAKGYLIEKQDNASGKWTKYKTIKKAKTSSYTFPATKDTEGVSYRIRAYSGTKYTNDIEVYVSPVLAAPTKVTAKATKNGIKVSWKAVAGADYYKVFRTTDKDSVYNKDTKSYVGYDEDALTEVGRYVADSSTVSGYRERTVNDMKVTTVEDRRITYSINGVTDIVLEEGPTTGVKYYYVVVAYKKNNSTNGYVYDNEYADNNRKYYRTSGYSKAASATFKETKPAATSISKITSKSKKVTLKYKASKTADGYEIERSTSKSKGFEVIKDVNNAATLTYVDKNSKSNVLKKGKTYYYRIRAYKYNEDGSKVYAKYSKVKSVKVK